MRTQVAAGVLFAFLAVFAARGQTPLGTAFTYQGQLKQAGQPFNGSANLVFQLYAAASAGNLLGTQTLNGVAVAGGLFTVQLNGAGEFGATAFNGEQRWLEISVNGTALSPRQELTATPYASTAMQIALPFSGSASVAGNAFSLTNTFGSGTALSGNNMDNGTGVYGESPNGAGVQGYSGGLGWGVYGNSLNSYGVYGQTTTGRGVFGSANGGDGVYGLALSGVGKAGVRGSAAAASGLSYGGYFDSASILGVGAGGRASATSGPTAGVVGQSASTSGTGVYGWADATSGSTYGVVGQSDSTSGIAVFGGATSSTGATYGGRFENSSSAGSGVFGLALPTEGLTNGVYGQSNSSVGTGVYGLTTATAGSAWGVFGESYSVNGAAIIGREDSTSGPQLRGVWPESKHGWARRLWRGRQLDRQLLRRARIHAQPARMVHLRRRQYGGQRHQGISHRPPRRPGQQVPPPLQHRVARGSQRLFGHDLARRRGRGRS